MSDESSPTAAIVPCANGVDALPQVLEAYLRARWKGSPDQAWRVPVRLMCEDARARGIQIEEVIISVKRLWPIIAGRDSLPRSESERLLARVITLCVEAYYAPLG